MQSMDEKQAQRVWSRVMSPGAAPAPPCTAAAQPKTAGAQSAQAPGTQPLSQTQLSGLIHDALCGCAAYRELARRMKGSPARMLSGLASQEQCHAKKLAAVYFLMTGKKLCPEPVRPPCITCVGETLRERYRAERQSAEVCRALACGAGEYQCLLQTLAREECEHAAKILCILQNCL